MITRKLKIQLLWGIVLNLVMVASWMAMKVWLLQDDLARANGSCVEMAGMLTTQKETEAALRTELVLQKGIETQLRSACGLCGFARGAR